MNKAILMGRLTRDPDFRHTPNNIPVTSFTLAINRGYKRDETSNQPTADFINIVAWQSTAEFVSKYFRKGQLVAVVGRIQTGKWTDKEGRQRDSFEVVADEVHFAEPKRDSYNVSQDTGFNTDTRFAPKTDSSSANDSSDFSNGFDEMSDEDELPF